MRSHGPVLQEPHERAAAESRLASMMERWVDIETPAGSMNTFVVHPDESGPWPTVLFYMDAYGQREELYRMARRIADEGYYVLLPNLYYRATPRFEADQDDPKSIERMTELMFGIGNNMIVRDTETLLGFVDDEAEADGTRIGCVGYCMSGPFVTSVAAVYPKRIACAASVYGAALVTERRDSPHLILDQVAGELLFICAEHDEWAPRKLIEELESHLRDASANYTIEWHDGTHHGFAFPERRGIYDEAAAERHWDRLFALFARNLRGVQ